MEDIKEWVDALADNYNERQKLANRIGNVIVGSQMECVYVYKGIDVLAKAVGAEVKEELSNSRELHYYYSFRYKGVLFLEAEEKKIKYGRREENVCIV